MRSSLRSFSHRPLVTGSVVHFGIGLLLVALTLLLLTRVAHAQAPIGPTQGSHVPQTPRSDQTQPGAQPAPVTDVQPAAPARPAPPPPPVQQGPVIQPTENVVIPGPLRSFERMAGISQQIGPQDLMPMLARKVYLEGYQQGHPTEFLLLVDRYLQQAHELATLAQGGVIKVTNCEDAGQLIRVLGYRLRPNCGQKDFSLETDNPTRAFLTIDSGFPLVDLEEALQTGKPFTYTYPSTPVPALFHAGDWLGLRTTKWSSGNDLVNVLINDPQIARLYYAMSMEDVETRVALQRAPGLHALMPNASVLEFYGGNLTVRNGHVEVPGGPAAASAWREIVGVGPENPAKFVDALLTKDKGWMAAYYDAVARVNPAQQKQLTEPNRLKHLYEAYRASAPDTTSSIGVFRRNADLLVLFSRVSWEADGSPHVPGDLATWKEILKDKSASKDIRSLGRKASGWNHPEQLLEGMTALSHLETDTCPLQLYLTTSEIDRERHGHPLAPATVRAIAGRYGQYASWYQVFSEFPALDDASVTRFIQVADTMDHVQPRTLRGNAEGSFQAALGLWQILARQGEIPEGQQNASWMKVINGFANVTSAPQLFDASRQSLSDILAAAGASSTTTQAEMVEILAGPHQASPEGARIHAEIAARIGSVLEDQRLVSLDTLFALNDGLKELADKKSSPDSLLSLAGELREFDLPRPIFTKSEKISWAPAIYTDHHAELQVRTDLTKVIKGPSTPAQLEAARGQLAPFLRDTLVGLNYAYYEPPDAQMLHHNPLFVRSHDFLGISVIGADRLWGEPQVLGVGTPAGGGAYLMGSLSDLSYALAATEQDFIAPKNIQALIVRELAPVLMVSSTVPRWWQVTPTEMHAAALYQKAGEELLTAAAKDDTLREQVLTTLNDRIEPRRMEAIQRALESHDSAAALMQVAPVDTLFLSVDFHRAHPDVAPSWGADAQKLAELQSQHPDEVSLERISHDFGVPHPTLGQTSACELIESKPFPFYGSYSSRLFAESWESSNLYWARLADDMGYPPAALNSLVPGLTRHMISNIFATDIEDWPAVLRALRQTGDEFRQGKIAGIVPANTVTHASTVAANTISAQ